MDFALIPGGFHGGWAWQPVAKRLRAAGHAALQITPPGLEYGDDQTGLRLQDAIDHVVAEVERHDLRDVTLVGHSWGGIPVTGAAHRLGSRVAKIVYASGFVVRPGTSAFDDLPSEAVELVTAEMERTPGYAWAPTLEVVQAILLQDSPLEAQRLLYEMLLPHPGRYGSDPLDAPDIRELNVPLVYLLAERDQGLGKPENGPGGCEAVPARCLSSAALDRFRAPAARSRPQPAPAVERSAHR